MRQAVVVVLAVVTFGCTKAAPTPPKNEFEAFERAFLVEMKLTVEGMRRKGEPVESKDIPTSYRAVFIGPSGVFVDGKLVATLAELDAKHAEVRAAIDANAKLLPTVGWRPAVTFDLDAEPASVALAALRLFEGRETIYNARRRVPDPDLPGRASRALCGGGIISTKPHDEDDESVHLSVLLDAERWWIGLSRVNEFQELPVRDFEKLSVTLRQYKESAFFEDRTDIELGASSGTSSDVLGVFEQLCNAGFSHVAVLPRDQLAAVPSL